MIKYYTATITLLHLRLGSCTFVLRKHEMILLIAVFGKQIENLVPVPDLAYHVYLVFVARHVWQMKVYRPAFSFYICLIEL